MESRSLAPFLGALLLAWPAFAEQAVDLGGLPVVIEEADGQMSLIVGDTVVLTDHFIEVRAVKAVDDVPTLVGFASGGDKYCAGSHFLVVIYVDAPRLEGQIPACGQDMFGFRDDDFYGGHVLFWISALSGAEGPPAWIWTPDDGLRQHGSLHYSSEPGLGYDALPSAAPTHPGLLRSFNEIARDIDALLGADRDAFLELTLGEGQGQMQGTDFSGTACGSAGCAAGKMMVFLDGAATRPYLAWVQGAGAPEVRPALDTWTPAARAAYDAWRAN